MSRNKQKSDIDKKNDLENKFRDNNRYNNFGNVLVNIRVTGFRCHTDTIIDIKSPITAFCGVNGVGKSTLIQLAAVAYLGDEETAKYINDFIVSHKLDPKPFTDDAKVLYKYCSEMGKSKEVTISRQIGGGWSGYTRRPKRTVLYIGVGEYLPKNEKSDYINIDPHEVEITVEKSVDEDIQKRCCKILSKKYEQMNSHLLEYKGITNEVHSVKINGVTYSEPHMGYGEARSQWIKEEAEKELAEFYPKDPDGSTPIAYLWARTIICEGPGCGAEVPLMRSLYLCKKSNRNIGLRIIPHKSTSGWEAQLQAMVDAGWTITGSWPIDTELNNRMNAMGTAALASSVHIVCRPRTSNEIGDWRDVLQELPQRIHEWMPRLASEGVVGADAIFACLGPALEIFSRYSSVEKASGEIVTLKEYLEYVWAAVSKEALSMIFSNADTTSFEEDARLTAMWLWTLSTGSTDNNSSESETDDEDDEETSSKTSKTGGYTLEYDAARKIAQGLGAHLEQLTRLVEVKGSTAKLLPVLERTQYLFGKEEAQTPSKTKGKKGKNKEPEQLNLFAVLGITETEEDTDWGEKTVPQLGNTTLDRIHQSMILFAAGRSEALKRFLVDEGAGNDQRFWGLAQALSALYPTGTDEKRWVDGVLARKKGLGF
jgi:hypothetical protein